MKYNSEKKYSFFLYEIGNMKIKPLFILVAGLFVTTFQLYSKFPVEIHKAFSFDSQEYLSNGIIKIGLDMTAGGSIFYFADSTGRNLLNHYDKGRFIQQSYYGKKDGSMWTDKPWCWNPIQGGGYNTNDNPKILDFYRNDNFMRVKSVPKHWATGEDVNDAVMISEIVLKENVAHVHFIFNYNGKDDTHPVKHQELPAVFVDAALKNLVFYENEKPWNNEKLTKVVPGWPNETQKVTENWAAYIDDNDWGIGIYSPGIDIFTTYRYKGNGEDGPKGSACSYFAPVGSFRILPKSTFEYDVFITIGHISEIRERFYRIKVNRGIINILSH